MQLIISLNLSSWRFLKEAMEIEQQGSKFGISRIISLILILAGISILIFFGFPRAEVNQQLPTPQSTLTLSVAPAQDALAPDFSLLNIEGEQIQLSDFQGQPVLINFWATWCGPCLIEMPSIQDRFEKHQKEGLVVLAIDFDEPKEDVAFFGEELGLTFDLLLDPGGEIQNLYRILGYPTSFFVDPDGVIKVLHIGVMTEGQLDDYLSQIGIDT